MATATSVVAADSITEKIFIREFVGSKNSALNNFSLNFTEVIMNANKVIPENLVAVR